MCYCTHLIFSHTAVKSKFPWSCNTKLVGNKPGCVENAIQINTSELEL